MRATITPLERPGPVPPIRVAILDDTRLIREVLAQIVATDPGLVVAASGDAQRIRDHVQNAPLEILLAGAQVDGALALCAELRQHARRPWVILFGVEGDPERAAQALEAGARGVLAKDASADDLTKAIRLVHEGQIWTRQQVVTRIVEKFMALSVTARAQKPLLVERLSGREQQILHYTVGGLSNQEVADQLRISCATVKAHVSRIFQKLRVRDRAQLIVLYHQSHHPTDLGNELEAAGALKSPGQTKPHGHRVVRLKSNDPSSTHSSESN